MLDLVGNPDCCFSHAKAQNDSRSRLIWTYWTYALEQTIFFRICFRFDISDVYSFNTLVLYSKDGKKARFLGLHGARDPKHIPQSDERFNAYQLKCNKDIKWRG